MGDKTHWIFFKLKYVQYAKMGMLHKRKKHNVHRRPAKNISSTQKDFFKRKLFQINQIPWRDAVHMESNMFSLVKGSIWFLPFFFVLFLCSTTYRSKVETVHRTVAVHRRIVSHGWSKSGHSRSRADAVSRQRRQRCLTEPFHFICDTKGITW